MLVIHQSFGVTNSALLNVDRQMIQLNLPRVCPISYKNVNIWDLKEKAGCLKEVHEQYLKIVGPLRV